MERSIRSLLRALLSEPPCAEGVVLAPSQSALADLPMPSGWTPRHFPAARSRLLRILIEQFRLPGWLRRHGVSLLHAPGYVMPLRAPCPTVLTVYDLIALTHPEWCSRANALHYGLLLPRSLQRAARIVCPSEFVRREMESRFPHTRGKVEVAPLGIDAAMAPAVADEIEALRRRLDLPRHYFLFVGNLEPKKNLDTAVRAAAHALSELPDDHGLVIAGAPAWGRLPLQEWLAAAGIVRRTQYLGYVQDADLPALYSGATALVFLSLVEGFGLPPLEALRCGCPAVVSDAGALPEYAGQVCPMVEPTDAGGAGRWLLRLARESELRREIVDQGSRVVAELTWERTARGVAEAYRRARE